MLEKFGYPLLSEIFRSLLRFVFLILVVGRYRDRVMSVVNFVIEVEDCKDEGMDLIDRGIRESWSGTLGFL